MFARPGALQLPSASPSRDRSFMFPRPGALQFALQISSFYSAALFRVKGLVLIFFVVEGLVVSSRPR